MKSASSAPSSLTVFIACSPKDEALKNELVGHMISLKRKGLIQNLHDQDITPGLDRDATIKQYLETAEVILLLLSHDFISSDFYQSQVESAAMQRHKTGTACVISILLRPCDWKNDDFDGLIVLPKNAPEDKQFVTQWTNRDEAFLSIIESIQSIIEPLQLEKHDRILRQMQRASRRLISYLLLFLGGISLALAIPGIVAGLTAIIGGGDATTLLLGVFFSVLSGCLFWLRKFFQ